MLAALFATDHKDWEGAAKEQVRRPAFAFKILACWNTGHNHTKLLHKTYCLIAPDAAFMLHSALHLVRIAVISYILQQ